MKYTTAAHCVSALIVISAFTTWMITGQEGYTRWPNAKLAASDAPSSEFEDALLADIGFDTDDDLSAQPDIQSRFAFGLLPGGFDAKHIPSLASAGAMAFVMSSIAAARSFSTRHSRRKSNSLSS